jgi:hypothetical protein
VKPAEERRAGSEDRHQTASIRRHDEAKVSSDLNVRLLFYMDIIGITWLACQPDVRPDACWFSVIVSCTTRFGRRHRHGQSSA